MKSLNELRAAVHEPQFVEVSPDLWATLVLEIRPAKIMSGHGDCFLVKRSRKFGTSTLFIQLSRKDRFFVGHCENSQIAKLTRLYFEEMLMYFRIEETTLSLSNI